MRPSLIIGASGLVGEHLVHALTALGQPPVTTYRSTPISFADRLDIGQAKEVNMFFERFQPAVVFLPAALTNVDYCETNRELSYVTNVIGVKNVVEAANRARARMIYFSTDYIFDGKSGPYGEDAVPNPISEYGRQKLIAEHYIALTSLNYLIIRTTVVYGWERQQKNFIYRLIRSLHEKKPIKVPMDQIGTPTYVSELAKSAVRLASMDVKGVINIAGATCMNRYEFALEASRIFNLPEDLIYQVTTKELDQPARRPLLAGLRTDKAAALLETTFASPSEGLTRMRDQQTSLGNS